MWQLVIASMLLAVSVWYSQVEVAHARITVHNARTNELAQQIEQLSTIAKAYAAANTGVTGNVSLATAGAPAWFAAPSGAAIYVQTGTSYAYVPNTGVMDLAAVLGTVRKGGITIGVSVGGNLQDGNGAVLSALPAGVPNGYIVEVQ